MKLYADSSTRFARQLVADCLFVCWVIAWLAIGSEVHDGTMALADPGHQIESSATGLAESMAEAGDFLGGVPVIGGGAAAPFDKASDASESLASAGRVEVEAVKTLAFWLGVTIALIPILVMAVFYVPGRIRFVREASAGQHFVDSAADDELFALCALTNQPMHVLARISDDPVGALRRGDTDVIRALAAVEMKTVGLQKRPLQRT